MRNEIEFGKYYWAQFNRFEMRMPGEAVIDLSASGQRDSDADYWAKKVIHHDPKSGDDWSERNGAIILYRATPDDIRTELKDYGAWDDEELADDRANMQRLVWIAGCDIAEEEEPDSSDPV